MKSSINGRDHIVYVKSGVAQPNQLVTSIERALIEAGRKLGRPITCDFKVNLIFGRGGHCFGFGYIWFSNPQVVHLLLGRNPNGSERVTYHRNPNWKPPERPLEEALEDLTIGTHAEAWADYVDEEEALRAQYQEPITTTQLPPLVELPSFVYNTQQQVYLEDLDPEDRAELIVATDQLLDRGGFELSPIRTKPIPNDRLDHVLCSTNVPDWVNERDLQRAFQFYATTKAHPQVTISYTQGRGKRMAYVEFDRDTRDAQYACFMTRKLELVGLKGRRATLIFDHALQRN